LGERKGWRSKQKLYQRHNIKQIQCQSQEGEGDDKEIPLDEKEVLVNIVEDCILLVYRGEIEMMTVT